MATGAQFVSEAESLGGAAKGYSETLDGGIGPQYFDCSGLVQTSLKALGISVPRTSEQQWAAVPHISASQLQPGDLIFANFPGEVSPGHVGIYIGNGNVYSARSTASGIGTDTVASWGSAIVGYGRPSGINGTASATTSSATVAGISLPGIVSALDPTTWIGDIKTSIDTGATNVFKRFEGDVQNGLIRLGLILLGGVVILVGIMTLFHKGSGGSNENAKQMMSELVKDDKSSHKTLNTTAESETVKPGEAF